jgi:hypothetical protein
VPDVTRDVSASEAFQRVLLVIPMLQIDANVYILYFVLLATASGTRGTTGRANHPQRAVSAPLTQPRVLNLALQRIDIRPSLPQLS